MSLLTEAMEDFYIMNKISADDGYGGAIFTWSVGAAIKAAINVPDSEMATIADKLTERKNCKVYTSRTFSLQANDYLKRKSDNLYFHILEDGRDNKTPASASLDIRVCKAEILTALPDLSGGGS